MRVAHPSRPTPVLEAGTPLLELQDVAVSYGGIKALRGVSMNVAPGEIVALIGANGAGKTTTLRTMMGLLPLQAGRVRFQGKDLEAVSTEERVALGMSLVPEGRAIFQNLTVRENLELGAYLHRDATTIAETIADVVALFPRLGERMAQEGGTLSGGEQQMLAIGRGLMSQPRLLILDEPSLGLSPLLTEELFTLITTLHAGGLSILLVEQNVVQSLAVAGRAYVIEHGRVALSGDAVVLGDDPRLRAAYLGL